jgi:hypothetical protein
MNKTKLTTEDLSKAIQFMKDHCVGSDEMALDRLMGWIRHPIGRIKPCEPSRQSYGIADPKNDFLKNEEVK